MKEGWRESKLGEIYSFKNGVNFNKNDKTGKGILTLDVLNMYRGCLKPELTRLYRVDKIFQQDYYLEENDILIVRSSVKKEGVAWATYFESHEEPITYCGFIIRGRPLHQINPRYTVYFLRSPDVRRELISKSVKSTITNINQKILSEVQIPIPPLAEQKAIVEVLDKAFDLIDNAKLRIEKNIANAKELFQSKLNQIFSQKGEDWVEKTLPEAATEFGRGKSKHRPRNAEFLYGGPYPFVQTGDIRNSDHTITSYTQTYSEDGLAQSKLWPADTICITIAANIAETGILGFEGCFPDSVIGMIPDPTFTSSAYVEYLLRFFKVELQAVGKGAAQDNINLGTFKNRNFPFAPYAEQEKIIQQLNDFSNTTSQLQSHYQTKLTSLDELKKSILQKAFAGELT